MHKDQSNTTSLTYVLITPAYNEEAFIEKTIRSVISQTVLPHRWIIVSDGSTDRTDDIVKGYLPAHPFIELLRMPEHRDRQFAAKVHCFNTGYNRVKPLCYDIIANLDADISFEPDYLEFLLEKFRNIPDLGVAGTPFVEDSYSSSADSFEGERHVAGGCQLFRRECFEEVGGYQPVKGGGIDWIAVTTARMKGWKTVSFNQKHFFHHRSLGTGKKISLFAASFEYGKKDYYLGGHPVWQLFRVLYRMTKKPFVMNGMALLAGYLWAGMCRMQRPVSPDLMKFHRQEQMQKLKSIFQSVAQLKKLKKYS